MKIGKAPEPRRGTKPVKTDRVPEQPRAPKIEVKLGRQVRPTQPGEKRRG